MPEDLVEEDAGRTVHEYRRADVGLNDRRVSQCVQFGDEALRVRRDGGLVRQVRGDGRAPVLRAVKVHAVVGHARCGQAQADVCVPVLECCALVVDHVVVAVGNRDGRARVPDVVAAGKDLAHALQHPAPVFLVDLRAPRGLRVRVSLSGGEVV